MFGYVLPRKDLLSEQGRARYRAAYCGLCRSLKENYGFRARFLVNYDMTFLYFVLHDGAAAQTGRCSCPARPFCKKDCLPDEGELGFAADLSVLLSVWKLRDALRDGRAMHRLAAKSALLLYRGAYRKAKARQKDADAVFERQLSHLQALEDAHCASLDRAADAFASLLRVCASYRCDESARRASEQLLYHVGRFLYLADALEDLPKDERSGSYNPLRYRFTLQDGKLSQEDRQTLLDTVEASISMAASALELLPASDDDEIRKNIIYYGLPAVLHGVANGTFRKKKRGKKK